MPYIRQDRRDRIDAAMEELLDALTDLGQEPGDLNYVITRIIHDNINQTGMSYINLNTVMGVLESATQEFYRRIVAPYEDQKIESNGDVSL